MSLAESVLIVLIAAVVGAQGTSLSSGGFDRHPSFELLPRDCGEPGFQAYRILAGDDASPGEYPWMAKYYTSEKNKTSDCGSSIISSKYILTAAHCCGPSVEANILPSFGVGNVITRKLHDEKVVKAEDVIIHPKYRKHGPGNITRTANDICLIRLDEPLDFTDYIRPICLPVYEWGKESFYGKRVETAGWGSVFINPFLQPDVLQKVTLTIMEPKEYQQPGEENIFAAGRHNGVYHGDSGSPLMTTMNGRYFIIGTLSDGDVVSYDTTNSYWPKVYNYIDWILENMKP